MAGNYGETVFLRHVALVVRRKTAGGAVVGVILRDDRVQIVAGHVARCAHAERVPFPCVLVLGIDPAGSIGTAEKRELSMKSWIVVPESIDLDDAPHLPAKFRGNASGINPEGIDVIGFDFRTKARRAIVGERYAVHYKLGLILRSAWVKHGIALVKPAGF